MKLTVFSNRKNNFRSPILKISENIIFEIFKIFNLYHKNSIGGHYAVTRSVLVGLKKNKIRSIISLHSAKFVIYQEKKNYIKMIFKKWKLN